MPIPNYDNTLLGQYIRAVENPGSTGYDGGSLDKPKQWKDLSLQEMSDIMGVAVKHGITSLKDIRDKWNEFAEGGNMDDEIEGYVAPEVEITAEYPYEQRVIDTMNKSDAEFMQRLRNNDTRSIANDDGSYSTHVLGSADNIVFPSIQDVNGQLVDYRSMPWESAMRMAIDNNDYIAFPTEGDARYFGEHYKKYFPEFFSFPEKSYGGNLFKGGGYMPSKAVRDRIANWEGSSMKTNRSFEAEAADFNRVIPQAVRDNLSQEQLDALYSYGYNVGMGNLKARVLPTLQNYVNGRAGAEDVASSMWASRDKDLRGLQRRRAYERNQFVYGSPSDRRQSVVDAALNMDLSSLPSESNMPLVLPPNPTDYGQPVDYNSLIRTMPVQEDEYPSEEETNRNSLLSFMSTFGLLGNKRDEQPLASYTPPQKNNAPFVVSAPTYNATLLDNSWFAEGGPLYKEPNIFAIGGKEGVTRTVGTEGNETTYHIAPEDYTDFLNHNYTVMLPEVEVTAKKPDTFGTIDPDVYGGNYRSANTPWQNTQDFMSDAANRTFDNGLSLFSLNYKPTGTTSEIIYDENGKAHTTGVGALQPVYPEFDLIGLGGGFRNMLSTAYRKAAQGLSQKSVNKAFVSELDWNPENYFNVTRSDKYRLSNGLKYDAEDVAALKSHIPEYLQIEQQAKANGTWLKMPDGSTWTGDPRDWVMMHSKAYEPWLILPKEMYTGVGPFDIRKVLQGDTREAWLSDYDEVYNSFANIKGYPRTDPFSSEGETFMLTPLKKEGKTLKVDFEGRDFNSPDMHTEKVVRDATEAGEPYVQIDNVVEGPSFSDFRGSGKPSTDFVITEGTPRKSVRGNNGNFSLKNRIPYKGLIPWGIPSLYSLFRFYNNDSQAQ